MAQHVDGVNVASVTSIADDGTTDDTTAFTAVLAFARVVTVPTRTTLLLDEVAVPARTVLQGDGCLVQGLTFAAETTSGQPSTDIKLADASSNIRIIGNYFKSPIYSAIATAGGTGLPSGNTQYATP